MTNLLRQLSPALRHAGGLHTFAVQMPPGLRMDGHRHTEPTIVILLRGGLQVVGERGDVVESAGTVRLCAPGSSHSIRTVDGADCLIVSCDPSHAVARHFIWRSVSETRCARYVAAARALEPIERAAAHASTSPLDFETLFLNFLTALLREQVAMPVAPPWLEHALTTLSETAGRRGACRSVARDLGIHPVHLARVVRRFTGLTPRDYLRRERIVHASRVLRSSAGSVSRVAHQTGFADHSHFTREFVRRHRRSPSDAQSTVATDVVSIQASELPAVHLGDLSVSHNTRRGETAWDGKESAKG